MGSTSLSPTVRPTKTASGKPRQAEAHEIGRGCGGVPNACLARVDHLLDGFPHSFRKAHLVEPSAQHLGLVDDGLCGAFAGQEPHEARYDALERVEVLPVEHEGVERCRDIRGKLRIGQVSLPPREPPPTLQKIPARGALARERTRDNQSHDLSAGNDRREQITVTRVRAAHGFLQPQRLLRMVAVVCEPLRAEPVAMLERRYVRLCGVKRKPLVAVSHNEAETRRLRKMPRTIGDNSA